MYLYLLGISTVACDWYVFIHLLLNHWRPIHIAVFEKSAVSDRLLAFLNACSILSPWVMKFWLQVNVQIK